jgi:hypothetical protein
MSDQIDEILKKAKKAASAIERRLKNMKRQKADVELDELPRIRVRS